MRKFGHPYLMTANFISACMMLFFVTYNFYKGYITTVIIEFSVMSLNIIAFVLLFSLKE